MTEPMIEQAEAEDFTDELCDEALDRAETPCVCATIKMCVCDCACGGPAAPVADR